MPDPTPAPATGEPNPPTDPPEPPAEPTQQQLPDPTPSAGAPPDGDPQALGDAGKRALAAERDARKQAQAEAKDLRAELDELRKAQMSDQEKAIAEAEARGKQSAVVEVGERLADAEIRAALTGVVPDPAVIVEDLDLGRYVADDGDVYQDKVQALRAKYEALLPKQADPPAQRTPVADLRPGALPEPPEPTVAEQIAAAEKAGDWATARRLKTQQLLEMATNQT